MQVHVQVNEKYVRVLLDTGADSNYLAQHMVDRLGLTFERVKAVNLGVVAVLGETEIGVGLGTWHGQCMMNVIPLVDFEMVLGIEFFVKAKVSVVPYLQGILIGDGDYPCFIKAMEMLNKKRKEASSAREKHNETLGRRQCLVALESKSKVVAESVGLVNELQSSMACSSGPIEFQGKLGNCSRLGRGPKQQMKHEGSVTVGQMQCKIGSSGSLGEGMTHRRQRVSMVGGPSSEKEENFQRLSHGGKHAWNKDGAESSAGASLKCLPTRTSAVSSGGGLLHPYL
ncbi:hypothetical protein ACOSQ3_012169 [Xanthoceras sorbifolium]